MPFKFQLSDLTLFSVSVPLQMRSMSLADRTAPAASLAVPADAPIDASQGYCVRALPITGDMPIISVVGDFLCYMSSQYRHCFIDLDQPFENYEKKFSSKTRSTIKRKVRKYAEHCGGTIPWSTYRTPDEMRRFISAARVVSSRTYQEKLLDAGIPSSAEFIREMEALAADDRVRAYVLFDGERPVSYLYCPVVDDSLIYAYLGYDPEYMRLSVGTVLQWLAVEQLFKEGHFKFFDFTEGESDHKRLFATHDLRCATIVWLKRSFRNKVLIHGHRLSCQLSASLGDTLERLGVKARVKRLLRFAR